MPLSREATKTLGWRATLTGRELRSHRKEDIFLGGWRALSTPACACPLPPCQACSCAAAHTAPPPLPPAPPASLPLHPFRFTAIMALTARAFIVPPPLRAAVAAGRPAAASRVGVVCKARPPPAGGRAKRAAGGGRKRRASGAGTGAAPPTSGQGAAEGASTSPRAAGEAATGRQATPPPPPPLRPAQPSLRAVAAAPGESVEATLERDLAGFRSRQRRRDGKDDSEGVWR